MLKSEGKVENEKMLLWKVSITDIVITESADSWNVISQSSHAELFQTYFYYMKDYIFAQRLVECM